MGIVLTLLQLPAAFMASYLVILSGAASLWRRSPPGVPPGHRFALLIPAHDEEVLLPRLLESIARMEYPQHLYDVHVVADNCTDGTAVRAAAHGSIVHERQDTQLLGKGYALRWLLERVRQSTAGYDAYVILDADSVVSSNFLEVMNRHLARGDSAIQCYYGVLNAGDSWSSGLRYAALALYNNLRPQGRDALGLSAGLRGNGMCFTTRIMERCGWEAFTLAEDAEFHLSLVEAGEVVRYAPDAVVLGEMPTSLAGAQTQNVRWERGRLQMLLTFGPRLLAEGFRHRDPVRIDAVAEQLVPPLSVLTGMTVLMVGVTSLLHVRGPRRLASLVAFCQIAYVLTGLRLVRAGPRVYLAFLGAPLYILWKLWIYAVAALRLGDTRWIRTARTSGEK